MSMLTIRTSDKRWVAKLADAYNQRLAVRIEDDAGIGIDPTTQTILEMGRQAGLSYDQWPQCLCRSG